MVVMYNVMSNHKGLSFANTAENGRKFAAFANLPANSANSIDLLEKWFILANGRKKDYEKNFKCFTGSNDKPCDFIMRSACVC